MTDSKTNAVHEPLMRDEELKGSSNRAFGIVFAVVFAVIGLWPLIGGDMIRLWATSIAAGFLAIALIYPGILTPLNRLWMKFGLLLHKITNPIIMGLIFFVTVTPIALIMRMVGKDPLHREIDPETSSYWIDRKPPGPPPETMTNQF